MPTTTKTSWLNSYTTKFGNDELFNSNNDVKGYWKKLFTSFDKLGESGLKGRQKDIDWLLLENGVTYNVYNDPKGMHRPWNLNVVPLVMHRSEWENVEEGLKQRAELLNLVLKDAYGERRLIKDGVIPHEVIYGHRGFLRQCSGIEYTTDKLLSIYSADLARGNDGRLWVVNDRTEAPSGMGYALENRSTTSRILPEMYTRMNVKRLSNFFKEFHQMLIDASPSKKDNPNIVILTPGSHNETYFEHAYMASFLGYPLVQGNDLVVRDGFLWMKSLQGLKRIDVVLRRVDDAFSDPLELREDSHLGVAGLLDVVRRKNISVINPVGSGVIENPGLIPFMPAIAKYFLNEDLILPQIASWWCGQEKEKSYVLQNLSNLVVKRIDRTNRESIYFGKFLTPNELESLKQQIIERPYRFVAQEQINFSTAPNLTQDALEPRNVVTRAFVIANGDHYGVMPGGLVRVAPDSKTVRVSNQRGGTSKDFWVVEDHPIKEDKNKNWEQKSSIAISGLDDLPSLTAENLYWAGRYVGRTLVNARFIRTVMRQMAMVQNRDEKPEAVKLQVLLKAVTHLTGTYPGFAEKPKEGPQAMENPYDEMLSVIRDQDRVGSLAHTIGMFSNSYYSIRNLWSSDMWRVFEDIQKLWQAFQADENPSILKILKVLNQLITRLIAFMGLIEESIMVQQGLLLYFIGLQLEQSMLTITKCRSLLAVKQETQVEYDILEYLLTSHESLNIYRYSYRSYIQLEHVVDLVILDVEYARSLTFLINRLQKDISRLPHSRKDQQLTSYQKYVFSAYSKLRLAESSKLCSLKSKDDVVREELDKLLGELSELLYKTSQSITGTYFNHTDRQTQMFTQSFPF
ncbi:circularly permuted type 2 ATP-grasp protein [Maribacter sp. PR1]|uniref:Circularly permuted type 2 ATP-grasp protein n=1 Tax=Maribacter cobaltidurans TaxID=1178778 RepID=A0ABU7IUR8_9FLAO|nr:MULTISPECIES: circularly permuted type 2 ATP-grasp protein [Maribacter]MDC6389328.1 circularly permuted type 2 ATP-grasp protein [Maribacter sp. PR1]MEE1976716.1 circularly permuted type 2 ATP-grasp protein [Maribacter cobaltidurans]